MRPSTLCLFILVLTVIIIQSCLAQTICPKGLSPAKMLYVTDISSFTMDEQLFFSSVQGIVAQKQPRIYLIREKQDEFWLEWMKKKGYIDSIKRVEPWELPEIFKSEILGAAVPDPELPATVNVATMLAGVYRVAVCSPAIAGKTGLSVKWDLRGRWTKNTEAYGWVLKNLYPMLNRRILASLHPFAAQGRIRDYLVQHKVFTFWITGPEDKDKRGAGEDEKEFIGKALKRWPENIPVTGFWYAGDQAPGISEYEGLIFAGEQGKFTVVYDWGTNTSVHSGIRVPPGIFTQKHAPKLVLDPSKVYVMITQFESGDCPWYWERLQTADWQSKEHGTFPMGWCLGPATLDLMPDILQWFYENSTPNDYFFCSMSGAGYQMVPFYATKTDDPEKTWRGFLDLTSRYMKMLDLDMISLHTDAWHAEPQYEDSKLLMRYVKGIPGIKAILSDFGNLDKLDPKRSNHYASGIPVFHTRNRWIIEGDAVDFLIKQIRDVTPEEKPAFLSIIALSWTYRPAMIKAAMDKLGNDYIFVTPRQMTDLYKASGENK